MDLESVSDFFLGEDLEKKAGRTMEMMMAPGNTGLWGVADSRKNGLSLQGTVRGIQRTPSVSLFCSWRTGNCFSSCCSVLLLTVTASSHNSINSDQVAVEYRNRTVKAGVTTKTTFSNLPLSPSCALTGLCEQMYQQTKLKRKSQPTITIHTSLVHVCSSKITRST